MAIEFGCPACKAVLRVPDDAAGQKGRCPTCSQKIRVPELPPEATAVASMTSMAIEFLCPRCRAVIRSPAEAAGQRGLCPQCQGKIQIPEAPRSPAVNPAPVAEETFLGLSDADGAGEGSSFDVGLRVGEAGAAPRGRRTAPPFAVPMVIVSVAALLVIVAIGAWVLLQQADDLGDKLTGVELQARELAPMRAEPTVFGEYARPIRAFRKCLEGDPVLVVSDKLEMEIRTEEEDLTVMIAAGEETSLYRVNTRSEPKLVTFLDKQVRELNEPRLALIKKTAPEFLQTLATRCERGTASSKEFIQYRNSIGFAACVKGMGFHVQAAVGGELFPCVREGDGLLYFVLPRAVKTFEIVPRNAPDSPIRFPGRFTVHVSRETPKQAKPDGRVTPPVR